MDLERDGYASNEVDQDIISSFLDAQKQLYDHYCSSTRHQKSTNSAIGWLFHDVCHYGYRPSSPKGIVKEEQIESNSGELIGLAYIPVAPGIVQDLTQLIHHVIHRSKEEQE